jgi:hypothetical protein
MKKSTTLFLFLFQFLLASFATTIYVPSDYPTIQDAINNAFEGDIILVEPGTYSGEGNYNITFYGKQLELRSEQGAENTIIDCQGLGRAFEFNSGEVNTSVLDGFTITNGYVDNQMGVGIKCMFSSPTIENCIFEGFDIGWGSILYFTNNTSPVRDCEFTNNNISQGGRIVYYDNSWEIIFENNVFSNNSLYETAELLYLVNTDILINECDFFGDNVAYTGIKLWNNASADIVNCMIKDFIQYGIYCSYLSYAGANNCILMNNGFAGIAAYEGGQIQSFSSTIIHNYIGVYAENGFTSVFSSILFYNTYFQLYTELVNTHLVYARNSNIQDGINGTYGNVTWYDDNIETDPQFINPLGESIYDFYLNISSPCINEGDPETDYPGIDILGNPRVYNGIRDMGAIEYQGNILDLYVTSENSEICEGETSQLNAYVMGGSGSYTYSWTSTPEGFESSEQNPLVGLRLPQLII